MLKKVHISIIVFIALAFTITANAYDFGPTSLTQGSRGTFVSTLQTFLGMTPTGYFGTLTKAKVIEWQSNNGLVADGVFGRGSKAKANGENISSTSTNCASGALFDPTTGLACSSNTGASSTGGISRTLKLTMTGEDVRTLQKFLNNNGYVIATSGFGSPNNESTYFGLKTKLAVMAYQRANGLTSDGSVGPMTRSKMGLGGGSSYTPPPTGCSAGALFNPATGARCGTTNPSAGCASGALFDPTTGASCGGTPIGGGSGGGGGGGGSSGGDSGGGGGGSDGGGDNPPPSNAINCDIPTLSSWTTFTGIADNVTDITSLLNTALSSYNAICFKTSANYYKISGTVTVPVGKSLLFENGAKLNITGGLVGNGTTLYADDYQIFSPASILNGTFSTTTLYVNWFGPSGNGTTDDFIPLTSFFNLLGKTNYTIAKMGIDKNYYSTGKFTHTLAKPFNLDGRGSKIFTKYTNHTTGGDLLLIQNTPAYTKSITANLTKGSYTLNVSNTTGLTPGMGIWMHSNQIYSSGSPENPGHIHHSGLMSKISSISGNTITMTDPVPYDMTSADVTALEFININPVTIKNLDFGIENISGSIKLVLLRLKKIFNVTLENMIFDPLGYSGLSSDSVYNGYIKNIDLIAPASGGDATYFGVYGIVPSLNVNTTYDDIYGRAMTHGIAFTALSNAPSSNVTVKNSDLKSVISDSSGFDSHASVSILIEDSTLWNDAQGASGSFVFDNCIFNGDTWNEREHARYGGLSVEIKNSTMNNSTGEPFFLVRPRQFLDSNMNNPNNVYIIKNNTFNLSQNNTQLVNMTRYSGEESFPFLTSFTFENNEFKGSPVLYLPENYLGNTSFSADNLTFKNNTYNNLLWNKYPGDSFKTLTVQNNTPISQSNSSFGINWENGFVGDTTFSGNTFVGKELFIKNMAGNISFLNNNIYNNIDLSPSIDKDRNILYSNPNLSFQNNHLYDNHWTLVSNATKSGNYYNDILNPNDPGSSNDIVSAGSTVDTGINMSGLSDFTIISRAKMSDITTNAIQYLVGSTVSKLYLGFNPGANATYGGSINGTIKNVAGTSSTISGDYRYYQDNNWHTYVYQMKNGIFTVYVDGIVLTSRDFSSVYTTMYASGNILIGGIAGNANLWSGDISSFYIYNRAITLSEANQVTENPSTVLTGEIYRKTN